MHLFISKLLENHSCCRRNCPVYIIFVFAFFTALLNFFHLFLACLHLFRETGSLVNVAVFFFIIRSKSEEAQGTFLSSLFLRCLFVNCGHRYIFL